MQRLIQDGAAAEQLNCRLPASGRPVLVDSVKNALAAAIRHLRHSVILIIESDVEEQVLFLLIHPSQAVLNDHGNLINKCRIVSSAGGNGARKDQAMPVLVLQTFAGKSCSTSSGAQ